MVDITNIVNITVSFERVSGLLNGDVSLMNSENAKKILIGLARDLRGLAYAFNTKTAYMMLFDYM